MAYLIIFFGRVLDVSIGALRTNLLVRGYKGFAAMLAFVEIYIWLLISAEVLSSAKDDPFKVFSYALGFSVGFYVGGFIEEKLAIGMSKIHIVVKDEVLEDLLAELKEAHFGVAPVEIGQDAGRHIVLVFTKRRRVGECHDIVKAHQEDAVVAISDMRSLTGGFLKGKLG